MLQICRILTTCMILACTHCSCPNYWTSFEGSCYTLIQNPSTWAEAEEICKDFDGFLVEINSSGENNFIKSFVKNKGLSVRAVWLGGNDLLSEANWMWSHSKLNLDFTDWTPGQPDNAKHAENCLELVLQSPFNYRWNDSPCSTRQYFICKKTELSPIIG